MTSPPGHSPPRVCIVIPCFNLGAYLPEALASARAVDYPHTEIVVVDDGSTDPETCALFSRLEGEAADGALRLLRQPHHGVCAARNRAIAASSADYILPLDADNRLHPDYIRAALSVLEAEPRIGVAYGGRRTFGLRTGEHPARPFQLADMLTKNRIDTCAVYRRQVWLDVGGYDEQGFSDGYEDWDFWLSAWSKGWQFQDLPGLLFDYRIRDNSLACHCNHPAVRRRLIDRLAVKHRELYLSQWPAVWTGREMELLEVERTLQQTLGALSEANGQVLGLHGQQRQQRAEIQHWKSSAAESAHILRDLGPLVALRQRLLDTWLSRQLKRLRYACWK